MSLVARKVCTWHELLTFYSIEDVALMANALKEKNDVSEVLETLFP